MKKNFTLLVIGMLIGGSSSILKAQTIDSIYIGYNSFPSNEVYETKAANDGKPLSSSRTSLQIKISNPHLLPEDTTIRLSWTGAAEYIGFPATVKIGKSSSVMTDSIYSFNIDHNWNMPGSVNGTKGIVYAYFINDVIANAKSDTATYYNYPTFTVEYIPQTLQYTGLLQISGITGSKPGYSSYMNRTLKKDSAYTYIKDTTVFVPFTDVEIANLADGDKIIVKTDWENYVLDIPGLGTEITPGIILRPVTVPAVSEAIVSVVPGIHQVLSTNDFSFTITPTGSNAGKVPVVQTGRTGLPDSEGVTYQQLSDGSWLVTIIRVQSAINLTIGFTVSNASIESSSVWTNGSQLYISTATSSNASIYSITGALVKTVAVAAGETAGINLPTGLYVITVNGKAYKVTVK